MGPLCRTLAVTLTVAGPQPETADTSRFFVTRIIGHQPQMVPIPDLPTRWVEVGDELAPGDDFVFLESTTVVITDSATGAVYTIPGPNRVTVRADTLEIGGAFSVRRPGRGPRSVRRARLTRIPTGWVRITPSQ